MLEQRYKGFYINGSAGLVHPLNRNSYPAGAIYKQGRASSIEEVTRFELPSFTMEIRELAEWFGLELCQEMRQSHPKPAISWKR